MKVLDLFAGIGGFSLGLERAGMETVAFCEIEDYPRKVLAKHWPDVPIYSDIRELTSERLRSDGIIGRDGIDVITAGFPCQDISTAGKGAGIEGERSGLWSEIARLTGELRPQYIILENVSALLSRGLDKVLGDLAEIGYDAEWHCIPASHLGAPHRRDRWWCVAYPEQRDREALNETSLLGEPESEGPTTRHSNGDLRGNGQRRTQPNMGILAHGLSAGLARSRWLPEPGIGRVTTGIPDRAARLKALGNSLIPQMPELIGRAIMAIEADR